MAVRHVLLNSSLHLHLREARYCRTDIPQCRLPLAAAFLSDMDRGTLAAAAGRFFYSTPLYTLICIAQRSLALRSRDRSRPAWAPWSAQEPFIDEVRRWWPSDEVPALEPVPVIEDAQPDEPPPPMLWPAFGGLLDTWV